MMPELKPLRMLAGDTLYQEGDHAEELYFIKQGKVKLHANINKFLVYQTQKENQDSESDSVDEKEIQQLVPFIAYVEGSHFGDVDIF